MVKHGFRSRIANKENVRVRTDLCVGNKPFIEFINPDVADQIDLNL